MQAVVRRSFLENWLVDLVAALLTGFAIWSLDYSVALPFESFDVTEVRRLLVKLVAFAVVALALSFWKHRARIHWAWIAIAIIGLVLTSATDEMLYRATATAEELRFMPAFSPFPLEIVVFFWQALLIMAVTHYLCRLILVRIPKLVNRRAVNQHALGADSP